MCLEKASLLLEMLVSFALKMSYNCFRNDSTGVPTLCLIGCVTFLIDTALRLP